MRHIVFYVGGLITDPQTPARVFTKGEFKDKDYERYRLESR